jgi:hypothetical protein
MSDEGNRGYLQHARDWTITRDAIVRLAARTGTFFTYGDLAQEIEEHDGLKIDGRGFAGALEAVAVHIRGNEPLWTSLVVNADTSMPGDGFWRANPDDLRYAQAAQLSEQSRLTWLEAQRDWCVATARSEQDPLDVSLREAEEAARQRAREILIELLLRDRRDQLSEDST